jgi:CrcB protein
MSLVWIFIGGGLGSVLRYLLSLSLTEAYVSDFPLGTLGVNLLGCFLIGMLAGLPGALGSLSDPVRTFGVTGFLGGFTTFSAFEYDLFRLLFQENQPGKALLNILLSVGLGLSMVWLGFSLMRYGVQALIKS